MPIDKINQQTGLTYRHFPERLQIMNLLATEEDVEKMSIEAYFLVSVLVNGQEIAQKWDPQPLIFNCTEDEELRAAMMVVQNRIGKKRYEQLETIEKQLKVIAVAEGSIEPLA